MGKEKPAHGDGRLHGTEVRESGGQMSDRYVSWVEYQ